MASKHESKEKVNKAIRDCDKIHASLNKAYTTVKRGVSTNGFGIYRNPSEVRSLILESKQQLEHALEILNAVDWPDNSDYDQVE